MQIKIARLALIQILRSLLTLIAMGLALTLMGQNSNYHLEVDGAARILGPIHINDPGDPSSMFVGTEYNINSITQDARYNTLIGTFHNAQTLYSGELNTLVGSGILIDSTGTANTVLGAGAGLFSQLDSSIVIGVTAATELSGKENIVIGNGSPNPLISENGKEGDRNVVIGHRAGYNIQSGDGNIFIGYEAGPSTYDPYMSNSLYIDNKASDQPLIYGNFSSDRVRINGDLELKYDLEIGYDLIVNDDLTVMDQIYVANKVGIGTSQPDLKLQVAGGTDVKPTSGGFAQLGPTASTNIAIDNDEIMARNNGTTSRISINREGGDIEFLGTSPDFGNVGIGLTAPEAKLHVTGPADANASGGGIIVSGTTNGNNIAIDRNEIMARNNGVTSALYLNFEGSPVHVGESIGIDIGTEVPTAELDVNGNARFRNIPALSGTLDVRMNNYGYLTTSSSDRRLKKNILTIENAVEKVVQLRGVVFNWKDDAEMRLKHGLIAQEVQEVVPELVFENDGFLGVNYSEMAGLFVEAIKDLKAENEQLKNQYQEILIQLNQMQQILQSRIPISLDAELTSSK